MKQFEDLITLTAYRLRTKPTKLEDLWLGGTFVISQLALASRSAVPYVLDILRAESGSPSIMAVICPLQSIKGVVPFTTIISHSSHYWLSLSRVQWGVVL